MTFSFVLLSYETAFSQTGIIVEPGENTIIDAMNTHPGETLILQKGQEYVVSETIEVTMPTVIMGDAYSRDGTGDPPAVMRGSADFGEEDDFYMILAAADLTLIDIGFIGFTASNRQIAGVCAVTAAYIDIEANGCILQGCSRWMETNGFPGTHFLLHNNIHFNTSTTGWGSFGSVVGPWYGGDSIITETYNNTVFVGGENMSSAGTHFNGSQYINHNTYVNTWGMTFYKCRDKDFSLRNCILFNTFLKGYVGERMWIDGSDTTNWSGDYISFRFGDTLNGDFAIFPHLLDSVDVPDKTREVTVTHNLKYIEQLVLDWNEVNNVTTQPFVASAVDSLGEVYNWTIEDNFMDQDGSSFDPQFAMGEIPDSAFEMSWAQRLDLMDPEIPDHEVVWRPDGAEQKDFIWPLPFDFTPINEAILHAGDDGYPLGDLNWFGPEVVAAWENGWPMPVIEQASKPLEMGLTNYPNPFSAATTISYNLPTSSNVTIKIYDVTGAQVASLVNEHQIAGMQKIMFNGGALSAGIYFCKIQAGNQSQHQKMTLIK